MFYECCSSEGSWRRLTNFRFGMVRFFRLASQALAHSLLQAEWCPRARKDSPLLPGVIAHRAADYIFYSADRMQMRPSSFRQAIRFTSGHHAKIPAPAASPPYVKRSVPSSASRTCMAPSALYEARSRLSGDQARRRHRPSVSLSIRKGRFIGSNSQRDGERYLRTSVSLHLRPLPVLLVSSDAVSRQL